jgi:hypothetical protein
MSMKLWIPVVASICIAGGVVLAAGCSTEPKPMVYTPAKIAADRAQLKNMDEAALNNPNVPAAAKAMFRAEIAGQHKGPGGPAIPAAK